MATEWSDAWAVISDPVRFAAKFNAVMPGAFRPVTADDVRHLMHCGLVGRRGFFERADLETVRGVLRYEQIRERGSRAVVRVLGECEVPGGPDRVEYAGAYNAMAECPESCGMSPREADGGRCLSASLVD